MTGGIPISLFVVSVVACDSSKDNYHSRQYIRVQGIGTRFLFCGLCSVMSRFRSYLSLNYQTILSCFHILLSSFVPRIGFKTITPFFIIHATHLL